MHTFFRGGWGPGVQLEILSRELKLGALLIAVLARQHLCSPVGDWACKLGVRDTGDSCAKNSKNSGRGCRGWRGWARLGGKQCNVQAVQGTRAREGSGRFHKGSVAPRLSAGAHLRLPAAA